MTTGGGDARDDRGGGNQRADRIGVGSPDDSVTRIQLAARWAEAYGSDSDSLGQILRRFKTAFDYLDAVIHGVEPPELDEAVADQHLAPPPPAPQVEPSPPTEQRTW